MENPQEWAALPEPTLEKIFQYLPLCDRVNAAKTCPSWADAFNAPALWKTFEGTFSSSSDGSLLKYFEQYGKYMEVVSLYLDQFEEVNRMNCLQALKFLTVSEIRRLRILKICFTGQNPYFYSGSDFVEASENLFGEAPEGVQVVNTLEVVDFERFLVGFDDKIIHLLSIHHPSLRRLKIQNEQLVNRISPDAILELVTKCLNIEELCIYKNSLSVDVLTELTRDGHAPLKHLSTISRREERLLPDIPGEVWQRLCDKSPALRVTMKFDHSCLIEKVVDVLKYEIPLRELWLETYMLTHAEIVAKCRLFADRLEKLVLLTPLAKPSAVFDAALWSLMLDCVHLRSLHVFTIISQALKEKILEQHPILEKLGSYTLESSQGLGIWTPGADY